MNAIASRKLIDRCTAAAVVTAGLKCAPDTDAKINQDKQTGAGRDGVCYEGNGIVSCSKIFDHDP